MLDIQPARYRVHRPARSNLRILIISSTADAGLNLGNRSLASFILLCLTLRIKNSSCYGINNAVEREKGGSSTAGSLIRHRPTHKQQTF